MSQKTERMMFRRCRRGERGQAITEMAVCLIAVAVVLLGFLLVSSLCITNVREIIDIRQDVEKAARSGVIGQDGNMISSWNYGNDKIPFTADDSYFADQTVNSSYFSAEVLDNDKRINLMNPDTLPLVPVSQVNSFGTPIADNDLFVSAAQLLKKEKVNNDPLHARGLDNTKEMIRHLFGIQNPTLKNSMLFPVKLTSDEL